MADEWPKYCPHCTHKASNIVAMRTHVTREHDKPLPAHMESNDEDTTSGERCNNCYALVSASDNSDGRGYGNTRCDTCGKNPRSKREGVHL